YTFKLREGITWSDGKPITAQDFAFSYKVITDPSIPNSTVDLFRQGVDAQGNTRFPTLTVLDERTFRFQLHQPDVLFHVNVASIRTVPEHAWGKAYAEGRFNQIMRLNEKPEDMPASGPFRIQSFASGERVVLVRNPRYWKVDKQGYRLPYLDKVIFAVVRDFNAQFVRFKDRELDAIEVRPEHYDALKREEAKGEFKVHDLGPALATYYLMFNLDSRTGKDGKPYVDPIKKGWFEDVRFRKAVSHAIDRDGIVRTVMAGRGVPLYSYFSPGNKKWFNPDTASYPYDLDKARALLTEAGFVMKDGKLHDLQGHPVEFSVTTNSENATRIAMLNVIKDDLAKLGMAVHLRPAPFNEVVSAMRNARNFDAILLGWGSAVPPDPAQSKNVLLSSGSGHAWDPHQATPVRPWEREMDDALYANAATSDFAERKKHMDRILAIWAEQLPQIMLVSPNQFVAGRDHLGNFRPSALRPMLSWNVEQMFLTQKRKR
ncbi:MAG: ABC transporter substrate-binding protein, partial [Myxococcales bacterium]|nr:ABC transporter substrate-binding protein [Myxococcales bacterium]